MKKLISSGLILAIVFMSLSFTSKKSNNLNQLHPLTKVTPNQTKQSIDDGNCLVAAAVVVVAVTVITSAAWTSYSVPDPKKEMPRINFSNMYNHLTPKADLYALDY